MGKPKQGPMEASFQEQLGNIIKRGKELGLTVTDICRDSQVARATPERWRKRTPNSVLLLDKMEAVVAAAEAERAAQS